MCVSKGAGGEDGAGGDGRQRVTQGAFFFERRDTQHVAVGYEGETGVKLCNWFQLNAIYNCCAKVAKRAVICLVLYTEN